MPRLISSIEVLTADLPFRFGFGHALATRHSSTGVYVKLSRWMMERRGTGRACRGSTSPGKRWRARSRRCAKPRLALLGRRFTAPEDVSNPDRELLGLSTLGPTETYDGSACCALELALLDASGKHFGVSVAHWLGGANPRTVHYDAVIPFAGRRKLALVAVLDTPGRHPQVKLKVGANLDDDLSNLRLMRRILGRKADLRVGRELRLDGRSRQATPLRQCAPMGFVSLKSHCQRTTSKDYAG